MKKPVRTSEKKSNETTLPVLQVQDLERVTGGSIPKSGKANWDAWPG